jgi:molybdenum cofactor biosynthesis enzyme MoaA
VRLSADGQLKLCLFGDAFVDLRAAVRGGGARAIEERLLEAMNLKPEKMAGFSGFTMMGIGG